MTRSFRGPITRFVPARSKTGLPRKQSFRAGVGSAALVRERLDSFAAAFLSDERPGLVFEYGRLVFANDAARKVLRSDQASDAFLAALKRGIGEGAIASDLLLRVRSGTYSPVVHPGRGLRGHPTQICFLIKSAVGSSVCKDLTEREAEVVTLLVKGLTNREIASVLGISIETVRKHVSSALEKTGTKTRAGLVGWALSR